ncbi:cytosolic phospholipase A2 gamma [Erethizon dorsatum]
MNPKELSKLPSLNENSIKVSIHPGLQKEEQEAVEKRSRHVLTALKKLSTKADEAPVIAVLGSGGGLRAHIACLGVLSELKRLGLLDAVTYLSGVSGSTWALSSFYTEDGDTEVTEAELKHRFDQKEWDLNQSLEKTAEAAKLGNYSLTDFWAYMVVSKQTRELQDSYLSSLTKHVEEGTLPYPIFAAIDGDLHHNKTKEKVQNIWFEFTPHHAGYPELGAYIPVTHFGSKFQKGILVRPEPERDLSFLKGGIKEKEMSTRELLHLVDAGFAINTPYPLVLLPARNVQLILSFDFSSGDPFETIRSTARYCHDHKIPFPTVEEAKLKEWSGTAPDSCYILKEKNGPVVMHFPLFNKDTCGDDVQKWIDTYGTIKTADSYTLDRVTQLLELSKENVRKNEEKIRSEIKNVVSFSAGVIRPKWLHSACFPMVHISCSFAKLRLHSIKFALAVLWANLR